MFSKVASILILAAAASACSGNGAAPQGKPGDAAGHPSTQHDAGQLDGAVVDASDKSDGGGSAGRAPVETAGTGGVGGGETKVPRAGAAGHAAAGSGGTGGTAPTVSYEELTAEVTMIASSLLAKPSDLAFNPYVQDELWVENHEDSSTTIIQQASATSRSVQRRIDPEAARHFAPSPTSLAFGGRETTIVDAAGQMVEGTFATCPEDTASYMGPTLWTSDLRIFAITKSERVPPFNGDNTGAEGPGSHIDMLHRTPTCTGIAWEGTGNIYWTYSGANAMFVRYDFGKDHGIGNDNHSDASQWGYAVNGIRYVSGIPSHLAWDAVGKRLYMADSGNGRVVRFDPSSVTNQTQMSRQDNMDELATALDMAGAQVQDIVPASYGLKLPSGVELHEQRLYVSDNETGIIYRFSLDGSPLGKLTIPGVSARGLAGMAFGPDGKLYFVDMGGSRVLRSETKF